MRILLLFIPQNNIDIWPIIEVGDFLLEGKMPFRDFEAHWLEHFFPPLTWYFFYITAILGNNCYSIKFFYIMFDFLSIYLLYKTGNLLFGDSKKTYILTCFYAYSPFIFLGFGLHGAHEIVTVAFTLLTIFYFLKEKYSLSYLFMSIGFMHTLFPVYLIVPFFLYLHAQKKLKKIITFIPILICTFIVISLPFFILIFEDYVIYLFQLFQRTSFSAPIQFLYFPLFDVGFSFNIFGNTINITVWMIIQFLTIFSLFLVFYFKRKIDSEEKLFGCIVCFFSVLTILTRSYSPRTYLFLFPPLTIYLLQNTNSCAFSITKIKETQKRQNLRFITLNIAVFIVYMMINFVFIVEFNEDLLFFMILFVYMIIWGVFILNHNFLSPLFLSYIWLFNTSFSFLIAWYHYYYAEEFTGLIIVIINLILLGYTFNMIKSNWELNIERKI